MQRNDQPDPGREARQLSPAAMVVVDANGVTLPPTMGAAPIPLDLAGLTLLARLAGSSAPTADVVAEVAERTGADPAALGLLVHALTVRDLLVEPATPAPAAPPVEPTAVEAVPDDVDLALAVPTVLRTVPDGFEWMTHDGRVAHRFSPVELTLAQTWRRPSSVVAVAEQGGADVGVVARLAERLRSVGVLDIFDEERARANEHTAAAEKLRESIRRRHRILTYVDAQVAALGLGSDDVDGSERTPVVPIHTNWASPPLSLGLLIAYARAHRGGALGAHYQFVPSYLVDDKRAEALAARRGIFLFSNYVWNHEANLALSARIKQVSPGSVIVHGGPSTPKYELDLVDHLRAHPSIDVAIRGEGEATFAEMLEALAGSVGTGRRPDLTVLADVAGLSFRDGDRVVRAPDRDRIADLDTIPSPFLTGEFDAWREVPGIGVVIETNRGCPYGCTFCDWGSATNSRVRKFDLERVFAELEWCAKAGFENISLADANFGIFERDVEIAERFAELKATYGYPVTVGNNYAKNTVKHLRRIIKVMADAGIIAEGVVSLQSMDTETLHVIRRKNIKVEKYNELASEFHANHLPLAVDIMMGLPGSTRESFRNDLQECINRDVRARIHSTTMLPNSPMNHPDYRTEHQIVARPGEVVRQSSSFTEDDWHHMSRLRNLFVIGDFFTVLRHVARYVRSETGRREIDFYEQLTVDALGAQDRWPVTAFVVRSLPDLMVPPASWSLFVDELHDHLTSRAGIADDSALATVLEVQLAHLPARGRTFPATLELAHDFVAWHRQWLAACDQGHLDDWEPHVVPLRTLPPGTLTIDDPDDICRVAMGGNLVSFGTQLITWDFESPVARPRVFDHADARAAAEDAELGRPIGPEDHVDAIPVAHSV